MERWFHIYFQGKNEYSDTDKGFLELPSGNLLFSYLDIEWENVMKTLWDIRSLPVINHTNPIYLNQINTFFSDSHPFFFTQLWRLKRNSEPLTAIINWVKEMMYFYNRMTELLLFVLDTEGSHNQLSTIQRYHLLLKTNSHACVFAQNMYDLVSIQNRVSESGRRTYSLSNTEITDEIVAEAARSVPRSYIFFCADDIRPLIYLSFEHMVNEYLAIRKCSNCGRYFVPASEVALYCARIDPTEGKSCKEFASKKKYNESIRDDAAVLKYRNNRNTLNMRTKRAPSVYKPEAFEKWVKTAEKALVDLKQAKISEEEFYSIIELPPIKSN